MIREKSIVKIPGYELVASMSLGGLNEAWENSKLDKTQFLGTMSRIRSLVEIDFEPISENKIKWFCKTLFIHPSGRIILLFPFRDEKKSINVYIYANISEKELENFLLYVEKVLREQVLN